MQAESFVSSVGVICIIVAQSFGLQPPVHEHATSKTIIATHSIVCFSVLGEKMCLLTITLQSFDILVASGLACGMMKKGSMLC